MTGHDAMRLRAELDRRRRQLGLPWWQVAVQADVGEDALHRLRNGVASAPTREALAAWLHRHPAPPAPTPDSRKASTTMAAATSPNRLSPNMSGPQADT
jgi:hypothetical protein